MAPQPFCYGFPSEPNYWPLYRSPRCWLTAPGKKSNDHLEFMCRTWGKLFPQNCPCPECDPCKLVHEPLQALDHFSVPSHIKSPPICNARFRYSKTEYEPNRCSENRLMGRFTNGCLPYDMNCSKDNCCATTTTKEGFTCENDCGKFSFDLPFTVCQMDMTNTVKKRIRPVGGVASCIHPSEFHDLQTVYNLNLLDFYKIKSREQIELYRSPLAIDKRRKRVTIPVEVKKDTVLIPGEPIYVNATPIKWKQTKVKGGKGFEVCLPGPICIC